MKYYLIYFFSIISLSLLAQRDKNDPYQGVDFNKIDLLDSDEDGIKDTEDECLSTPKGVKTDTKGCPLDGDKDGVPDYQDKEPKSKKGAVVDEWGVALTDAMILEMARRDSIARRRMSNFNEAPTLSSLQLIDNETMLAGNRTKNKMPTTYAFADENKDGRISSNEITLIMDRFFEGTTDASAEKINALIDFFFEQ